MRRTREPGRHRDSPAGRFVGRRPRAMQVLCVHVLCAHVRASPSGHVAARHARHLPPPPHQFATRRRRRCGPPLVHGREDAYTDAGRCGPPLVPLQPEPNRRPNVCAGRRARAVLRAGLRGAPPHIVEGVCAYPLCAALRAGPPAHSRGWRYVAQPCVKPRALRAASGGALEQHRAAPSEKHRAGMQMQHAGTRILHGGRGGGQSGRERAGPRRACVRQGLKAGYRGRLESRTAATCTRQAGRCATRWCVYAAAYVYGRWRVCAAAQMWPRAVMPVCWCGGQGPGGLVRGPGSGWAVRGSQGSVA
jgi:hypothetical protein